MEREIRHIADQSPVEKRPIAHGLEELRTVLGDLARVALTSGSEVMKLTREDFQSQTYQQAGYGAMPDRYVYTLEYADGTQLIIFGGKFAPARRFAGDPAPDPLADNRESSNIIYKYNGKNHTPSNLVVAHWPSEVESTAPLDFLLRHGLWTPFGCPMSCKIRSIISAACDFTTKSDGIWSASKHRLQPTSC